MTQEDVIAAVVAVFDVLGIRYMVTGSFASSLHGVPRMTNDADLVLDVDIRQVLKLIELLEDDFYVSEAAAREAIENRTQFNAIHFASGFKVDLVIKKDRAFSDQELERRSDGQLGGRVVAFASAEDTILTKLEWAQLGHSERQYSDAVGIIEVGKGTLDWEYLARWAEALGVSELLAGARVRAPFPQQT